MIRDKQQPTETVIDLTGPDGNAFALLGYAGRFATQLGYTDEDITLLISQMTSGDYENLVARFDKEFGDFVILER